MRRGWLSRFAGVVGFAVAQLLAVQLILSGVAATRMAVAAGLDEAPICSELGHLSPDGGTSKSPAAAHPAFCALCAFASQHAVPPAMPAMLPLELAVVTAALPSVIVVAPAERRTEPRSSQGPPSIV